MITRVKTKSKVANYKMDEKVYLVIAGEYSDRHEVAIFKTAQEAEAFCKVYNGQRNNVSYGKAWFNEMTLGVPVDYVNCRPYRVYFDEKKVITKIETESLEWVDFANDTFPKVSEHRTGNGLLMNYTVLLFAEDMGHAEKIAKDSLMLYLARKEGVSLG